MRGAGHTVLELSTNFRRQTAGLTQAKLLPCLAWSMQTHFRTPCAKGNLTRGFGRELDSCLPG